MNLKRVVRLAINRLYKVKYKAIKKLRLSKIHELDLSSLDKKENTKLDIIIFSKDRPLQLCGLLESMRYFAKPAKKPIVIYNASNQDYKKAYEQLFDEYADLFDFFINDQESGFKESLVKVLVDLKSDKILFFVDDILFKNPVLWPELVKYDSKKVIPSLRLSPHLNFCYTTNDHQILPPHISNNNEVFWYWHEGDYDWRYPLSVDGNVFDRIEILELIEKLNFSSPNTLESKMQKYKHQFSSRLGLCFSESIIFNNPINIVQKDVPNLHGGLHQNELLGLWNKNKRIDYVKLEGFINTSAHQEVEYTYVSGDI